MKLEVARGGQGHVAGSERALVVAQFRRELRVLRRAQRTRQTPDDKGLEGDSEVKVVANLVCRKRAYDDTLLR